MMVTSNNVSNDVVYVDAQDTDCTKEPNGEAIDQSGYKSENLGQYHTSVGKTQKQNESGPENYEELSNEECSLLMAFFNFLSFGLLLFVGYVKEFFFPLTIKEKNREGYVPLFIGFENFYCRNVYRRIKDAFEHSVCSLPGAKISLWKRFSPDSGETLIYTGEKHELINVASYNYLGFAENSGPCYESVKDTIQEIGISTCSPRLEMGTMKIHKELEDIVAEFMGTESSVVFSMGFATNSLNLPALLGKNCLVLSDECNHASLILGVRLSGATVKVFKHNDCDDLEKKLRQGILYGHPRTRRPWRKVVIIVEGIYSMEGTICNLPRILEIKKKYKAYLYVDEAHSVGALGKNGKGVVDYFNCDPRDVDILMGTFTKSFGSAGGYIAGSKQLINYLRVTSHAQFYGSAMSPPVARQIITSMSIIMGKDGTNQGQRRLHQLARNTQYIRHKLKQLGFIILGHADSPVVPLMLYILPKIFAYVQELGKRGVASVGVGFPATKIGEARMRFCLSAAHTKEMIDEVVDKISEVGDICGGKHSSKPRSNHPVEW